MSNDLTIDLPILASDYEQTIDMLEKENVKLREALMVANSQNNAALKCMEEKDYANAWRYMHDNYGVFGEALSSEYPDV